MSPLTVLRIRTGPVRICPSGQSGRSNGPVQRDNCPRGQVSGPKPGPSLVQVWGRNGQPLGPPLVLLVRAGPVCQRQSPLSSPCFHISTGRLLDRIGRRLVRIGRRRPQSIRPRRAGTRAALRRRRRRRRPPRPLLPGTFGRCTRGGSRRPLPGRCSTKGIYETQSLSLFLKLM